MTKRYFRIVTVHEGRYEVEYSYTYFFPSWTRSRGYVKYGVQSEHIYQTLYFNNVELAKAHIDEQIATDKRIAKEHKEHKAWKRKNPPIDYP